MSPRHGSLLLCLLALLAAPLALLSAPAVAQDYPAKPVRMIVPFAAGGPADLLARAIAPPMSAALRQSIVIENRVGAGGALGVDAVAKAATAPIRRDRARPGLRVRCRSSCTRAYPTIVRIKR